jgi:cytochrome P450
MTTESTELIDSTRQPAASAPAPGTPASPASPASPPAAPAAEVLAVLDPRNRANPYPAFRALRESARCHWLSAGSPRIGMVTRYADCIRLLSDPALGHLSMAESAFRPAADVDEGLRSMLRANPPTHTRLRRLVSRAFTAGRCARFGPLARQLAADLLDAAVARGEVDLVDAFARPLPLRIICTLLGVPPRDEEVFGDWASALTRGLDPDQMLSPAERAARTEGTRGFAEYFADLIARRRAEPTDDLLSDLIAVQEQDDHLSEEELADLCVLLLVAGYETTVNLVTGAVLALARAPEQYATLRARRDLVPATVEEALRFDPPIQWLARSVLADVEIAGHTLHAGDGVIVVIAAAQRDPEAFPEPDRFDVTRYAGPTPAARHLGFGQGIHYCLGAPLARLEAETMLTALLDRVGRIEVGNEPPPYRPHVAVRGASALPVNLIAV